MRERETSMCNTRNSSVQSHLNVKNSLMRSLLPAMLACVAFALTPSVSGGVAIQDAFVTQQIGGANGGDVALSGNVTYTVTPGAGVLVVQLDQSAQANTYVASTSVKWNGVPLTLAVSQISTNTSYVYAEVYYLFNPTPAAGGTLAVTGTGREMAVGVFTLSGVNTISAPVVGSFNSVTGQTSAVTLPTVPANSFAVVAAACRQAAGANTVTLTSTNGTPATQFNLFTDFVILGGGYVSGLAAGTPTITATFNTSSGNRNEIAVAVFGPTPVSNWSGAVDTNWSTAGNWDFPPSSSTFTILNFPGGAQITSNDDLAVTPFQLNALNHSNSFAGTNTISANAGNSIQFTGTSPALNATGSANLVISAPININANTIVTASGGALSFTGPLSGAAKISITGSSKVILNNASATASSNSGLITGAASGSLQIDSGIGTSNLVVGAGGTLTGVGPITGTVDASGATVSPGDNPGDTRTLTMGGLTLSSTTQLTFDLNALPGGANNDLIVVNGPVVDGATAGAVVNLNLGSVVTSQPPASFPLTFNILTSNQPIGATLPLAGLVTAGFHIGDPNAGENGIGFDATGQIIQVPIYTGTAVPHITTIVGNIRGTNGGNSETINGSNFTPASTVTIGGVNAPVQSETGGTKIIVKTPTIAFNAPTLLVPVQVSNGGTLSNTVNYQYVVDAQPVVTSLAPNYGKPAGGNTAVITGTGFFPNAPSKPAITIQGNAAALATETVSSTTSISLVTPAGGPGSADVVITNPDGQASTTGAGAFTYSNPTVTSVSPATGSSAGGTLVTITGDFFVTTGTGATVKFGAATPVAATVVNRNTITCTTPAATAATINTVDVLVTNTDGSQGTGTQLFTYVQPVTYSPFNVNTIGADQGQDTNTKQLTYFNGSQLVTITTPVNAGAAIYYTTDGTTPTNPPSGTTQTYTAPFTISSTTGLITVKAIAALGTPLQAGPVLNSVYAPYLPAAATPVQLVPGTMNYQFNNTNGLPPYNTATTTTTGIVHAADPDILTSRTAADVLASTLAPGTTQPLATLKVEGILLNGRPLAAGNSDASVAINPFQGRFVGVLNVPTNGVYTLVTGSDDGTLMWIDPTSTTAPDVAHIVVTNNVGQGVTRRSGQIGLLAGQHTIVLDYANTGGGFGLEALWDPAGGTNFVNIPNVNLGIQATLVATLSPTLATFGGTSDKITLTQLVTISNAAPVGASIFYTTDGSTPAFDANFNPTGTTQKYTTPFNVSATPAVGGTVTVKAIAAGAGYIPSATLSQTYTNVAPTVSSVSPAVGGPTSNGAQTITITGANFSQPGVTSVEFGAGLQATNVIVNSNTSITCTLPNFGGTVPTSVNVIVTNNDAQTGTLTNGFTFTGPPTITNLSVGAPNNPANSGTSLGGETFTLTGTNFAVGATVKFGANAATNINVVNSTSLTGITPPSTLPIPPGPGGPVSLTYTGQDGRTVSQTTYTPGTSGFNYVAAPVPTLSTVSPTVGVVAGGTVITITGTNFVAGAKVKIGGNNATNVIVNSNTSITATAPAGTVGIKDVTVTNVDSQSGTLVGGFTYLGPATGTAISVSFNGNDNNVALTVANGGIVNGTSTAPLAANELVGVVPRGNWNTTPSGTNGSLNNGTMTGLVDSTGAAAGVTVTWASNENWVDTEGGYGTLYLAATPTNANVRMMRCYLNNTTNPAAVNGVSVRLTGIPAGFGPFDVYVYGDGANGLTSTNNAIQREGNYSLYSSVPSITQHLVDAVNSNFANNPVFVQCLPTTNPPNVGNYLLFSGVNSFTGTLPAGSTGTAVTSGIELDVTATSADGSARAPVSGVELVSYNGFQFVGVTPAFGPIAGNSTIILKGAGFSNAVPANLALTIGGVAATNVTFIDANTASAVTGAGTVPGPQTVVFTNGDAAPSQATVNNGFAYLGPPPTLDPTTPITPNQGITSGGTAVTITGTNFVIGATVTIGGFPATNVVVVSGTQITAVTGAATKSGPSDVVVQNAGDSNIATAAGAFNYLAPAITSIVPSTGPSTGNYNAVITGSNFGTSTKVNFGTVAATNVVVNSTTQITCLVPGSLNGSIGAVDVVVTDGANSFGTLTGGFTYTTIPADNPAATVAGVEAKFYINGANKVPGNAPTAVPTALDNLPIVKGLRVDPAVTANIMTGPIADPGVPTAANVGTLPALVQDTLGVAATNFFMKVNGYINITTGGGYTFSMGSDDGSLLFIGGNLVIDANPTGGQAVTPKTGTANLQPGMHAFTILYGQGVGGYGFSLKYSGPDNGNVLGFVPDSVLFIDAGSPTLASVNPATGPIGGNTVVTATGTGFLPGATVSVNGVFATHVVVNSNTSITFTTPSSATNASNAVNVVVANPNGLAVTLRPFTYDPTQYRIADTPLNPAPGVFFRYYDLAKGDTNVNTSGVLPAPFDSVPYTVGARSTSATYAVSIVPGTPPTFTENVVAYPTLQTPNFAFHNGRDTT